MAAPPLVRMLIVLLFTAGCAATTAGCAAPSAAPQPVTLAELVADAERFDAGRVVVEGTVRRHADPPHAWLEDDEVHRVELDPYDAVADLVGSTVRVTGVFRAPGEQGRAIEVEDVEVLRAPARATAARSDPEGPPPADSGGT